MVRENASDVLEEYLKSVGGREKILEDAKAALKTKKRGRPSAGTPTNGTRENIVKQQYVACPPAFITKNDHRDLKL